MPTENEKSPAELTKKEKIQLFKDELVISQYPEPYKGGQMCGMPPTIVKGVHENLGILIEIKTHCSAHKNRELLIDIFDLLFDELIN